MPFFALKATGKISVFLSLDKIGRRIASVSISRYKTQMTC